MFVVGSAGAALVTVVGCGDDDTTRGGTDSGTARADGGPGADAGPQPDAGGSSDSGGSGTDASEGVDGGTPGVDAGTDTDAGTPATCEMTESVIGMNHTEPHVLMVPPADVLAGTPQTYDIQGTSRHNHTVRLTATHFAMLAAGMTVTVTSSLDGSPEHTHEVTIRCT